MDFKANKFKFQLSPFIFYLYEIIKQRLVLKVMKRLFCAPSIGGVTKSCMLSIANILCPECALLLEVFLFIPIKFSHVVLFVRMPQHPSHVQVDASIHIKILRMFSALVEIASKAGLSAEATKEEKKNQNACYFFFSFFSLIFFLVDCSKYKEKPIVIHNFQLNS